MEKFHHSIKSIVDTSNAVVGVAIKDLHDGEQFVLNATDVFPQASTIKIHILCEVFKQAAEGKFSLSDIKPVPASARVEGSGILNSLGESSVSMSVRDYCTLMMVLSDNTATNLLIGLVGMKNVNESLRRYGASSTALQRVMMDFEAAKAGRENISTPVDVMNVLGKMYRGDIIGRNACDEMLSIMKIDKDTWLKQGIHPSVPIADKPGDLEGVRCDAGIVFLDHNPYIICVMTKSLADDSEGERIITGISRLTYSYFERKSNSNQFGRRISK